jgi:hypothetical protein
VVKSSPISKVLKVRNTGIRAVDLNWQIFDVQDNMDGTNSDNFNLKVIRNQGIDRGEAPYKFAFDFIEPEESLDSIFSIEPKQVLMGPREVVDFTITYSPDKKPPGLYRSVVLASPSLT